MNTATLEGQIESGPAGFSRIAPKLEAVRANYRLRLAENERDLRGAQLLRFIVFNLELNEGLQQSYATCLDADAFDSVCDHLIVEDMGTKEIVGTYRLQTGEVAAQNFGYYSAQEFDFAPLEPLRNEMVELGRACVHIDHRNLAVLTLLWKGIALYAKARGSRYLVGCSSITSQDPAVGIAAYRGLTACLVQEKYRTNPLPAYDCGEGNAQTPSPKIPKLLAAYLAFGAKICGRPAIDREFKTIDFLTFLDLESLSPKNVAKYLT